MKINFKNINIIDLFVFLFILGIVYFLLIPVFTPDKNNEQRVTMTISVTENFGLIKKEAEKRKGQEIFLNGIERSVILESVVVKDQSLLIYCSAKGELKNPVYIFGGKRILIGQKIEIHSSFIARGVIAEITYED